MPHSLATRAKIAETARRQWARPEIRAKHPSQKGRVVSAEGRARMAAARVGRRLSQKHRAAIGAALRGRKKSAEHLAKVAAALRTAAARALCATASRGRKHSAETRAKIGAISRERCERNREQVVARLQSPEHREKVSRATSQRMRHRGAVEFLDRRGRLHRFKSKQERKVAAWLDAHEVTWDYEPDTLLLPDGRRYTPDFRVASGRYLEVKCHGGGTFFPQNLDKPTLAAEAGHDVCVIFAVSELGEVLARA